MTRSPPAALLAASLALTAPTLSAGDLGAALRRSASRCTATCLPAPLQNGAVTIPLRRVDGRGTSGASFFVGDITVGRPGQHLQVLFDTGSGHVLLPHRGCESAACVEHRRFSPWESSTAMDVNVNGSAVHAGQRLATGPGTRDGVTVGYSMSDLGEGESQGVLVRDAVCMKGSAKEDVCVDMAVLAATRLDDRPFRGMPNDGIVGLGLASLAAGRICSFLDQLLEGSRAVVPHFGIALGADRGELHFGSHERADLAGPLRWFDVDHPEVGLWQVAIQAVRVGNVTVDDCRSGCHGVVDTGVSRLGVQASRLPALATALGAARSVQEACKGPELSFDLGGMSLTLAASSYTDGNCAPQLGSLELEEPEFVGVYAFGTVVLQSYYAAFDWEQRRLGFAPLVGVASASAHVGEASPTPVESEVLVV